MAASQESPVDRHAPRSWAGPGESLGSPLALATAAGRTELSFEDGLTLYFDGESRWQLPDVGPDDRVVMQSDGNLVAYVRGRATWASGTDGFVEASLHVSDIDGLAIHHQGHPVWTSGRGYVGARLDPGAFLVPGGFLRSPDREFTLVMQSSDGNLVVYSAAGDPVWSSGLTEGGSLLMLDRRGDLRTFGPGGLGWETGTDGLPGASLELRDDGVLRLMQDGRLVWSTSGGYTGHLLRAGERLTEAGTLRSEDGRFVLRATGGRLALSDEHGVVWTLGEPGDGALTASMQLDGNFVIERSGDVIAHTATHDNAGAFLVLQDDGNVVVRTTDRALWSRFTGALQRAEEFA